MHFSWLFSSKVYAKQKQLGCKKGEVNKKQQLSDLYIYVTKSFDMS